MRCSIHLVSVLLFSFFILVGGASFASAADEITVSNIAPTYVEKGEENYLVTLQAHVSNHGTDDDNFIIEVIAVDEEGYQLQAIKLSGHVKSEATRVFMEQIRMNKQVYEQVAGWELKE